MSKRKVLIPLDGSEFSGQVLPQIHYLLPPEYYELVLAHVVQPQAEPLSEVRVPTSRVVSTSPWIPSSLSTHKWRELHSLVQERLEAEARPLRQLGYSVSVAALGGEPVQKIVRFVENEGIDLVAMATHGRSGLSRLVLGSIAEQIVRRVSVPVLLVRPATSTAQSQTPGDVLLERLAADQPLRITFATDGSPLSDSAASFAGALARTLDGELTTIMAVHQDEVEHAQNAMEKTRQLVGEPLRACVPLVGIANEVFLRHLRKNPADLLIAGHFADRVTSTQRSAIGTTAQRLLQNAPTSVLVVKGATPNVKKILACAAIGDEVVVKAAARFAKAVGAPLRLLHVVPPTDVLAEIYPEGSIIPLSTAMGLSKDHASYLRQSQSTLTNLGFDKEALVIRHGSVSATILQEARTGHFDLIVVGNQSGPGYFLGTIANQVVRRAEQSVLVVRMTT
ncbi:MAG: universal stress protein [Ardenticatenaceae bacterium]